MYKGTVHSIAEVPKGAAQMSLLVKKYSRFWIADSLKLHAIVPYKTENEKS